MRREPALKAPFRDEALPAATVGEADMVDVAETMNLGLAQAGTRRQGFDGGGHVFAGREPRENPPRQRQGSPQARDRPRGKRRRAPEGGVAESIARAPQPPPLSQPRAIQRSTRRQQGQKRRLILSTQRGEIRFVSVRPCSPMKSGRNWRGAPESRACETTGSDPKTSDCSGRWRRGWDSNPRGAFDAYSLSRGVLSENTFFVTHFKDAVFRRLSARLMISPPQNPPSARDALSVSDCSRCA